MTNNYDELKKLAEAATPLEADLYGDRYFQGPHSRADLTKEQDAFYRACTPAVVSGILSELTALRAIAEASMCSDCKGARIVLEGGEPGGCDTCGATGKSGACGACIVKERRAAASAPKAEVTDERAAFEAWARAQGHDTRKFDEGEYRVSWTGSSWEGWQARAVLAQAAPVAVPEGWNLPKEIPFETMKAAERSGISFAELCRVWDFLVAAAPAAPVAAAVPAGWRVAPEVPTLDMAKAGTKHLENIVGEQDEAPTFHQLIGCAVMIYAEMMAAAPAQETGGAS